MSISVFIEKNENQFLFFIQLNDIPVLLTRLPFSLPEFWCVGIVTPNLHNCDMKIKLLFKADLQLIINTDLSSH